MLITFVALGHWLQSYAKGKTSSAVQKLLEMTPDSATILTTANFNDNGDGSAGAAPSPSPSPSALDNLDGEEGLEERSIETAMLQRGDLCLVKAGERIPCDALLERDLTDGNASVDESMLTGESRVRVRVRGRRRRRRSEGLEALYSRDGRVRCAHRHRGSWLGSWTTRSFRPLLTTHACAARALFVYVPGTVGESMPVRKHVGDTLYGGTLNKAGPMWARAQGVGSATAVQGIVRLVEEAQSSKVSRLSRWWWVVSRVSRVSRVRSWSRGGPGKLQVLEPRHARRTT